VPVRKRASALARPEQQRYITSVTALIANGTYGRLVAVHADMSHMQHGSMGAIGRQRFLPWHREYLRQFEQALQDVDVQAFVPYWRWENDRAFPTWLGQFHPDVTVPGVRHPIQVHRSLGRHGRLPSSFEVGALTSNQNLSYADFTTTLEGFHNDVHNWVGSTMGNLMFSPADPIFWLHHAAVDRRWSAWQVGNPGKRSTVPPAEEVLDPWAHRIANVQSIATLGYSYQ